MLPPYQRRRLTAMIERGQVTPAEVARHTGLTLAAVHKWIDSATARNARNRYAAFKIDKALAKPHNKQRKARDRAMIDRLMANLSADK